MIFTCQTKFCEQPDLQENGDALEGVYSFTKMYKFNKLISALHQEYAAEEHLHGCNILFCFLRV